MRGHCIGWRRRLERDFNTLNGGGGLEKERKKERKKEEIDSLRL